MNSNQRTIVSNLEKARDILHATLKLLEVENEDGTQFDYVTSPTLSSAFDQVNRLNKNIEKIVYQE